jgi:hypothetical protein
MTTQPKPTETRAIGWYAVQRVRVADWFRAPTKRNKSPAITTPPVEQSTSENTAKATKRSRTNKVSDSIDENSDTSPDPQVEQKLQHVVNESHTVLAKATSVFPLELFPDTISIDRHKLTIIHREFFGVESTVSVPIENIKNIEADIGPFLGSITITSDLFINNTQTVRYLTRSNANMFQRLVQGAVVAQREDIDLNKIGTKKLRNLLIDLGSGHSRTISG